MLYYFTYQSPVGRLLLKSDATHLLSLEYNPNQTINSDALPEVMIKAQHWLDEYFAGKIPSAEVPLKTDGTEFQKKVWDALSQLKYGEIISYGDLSQRVGSHPRAVGQAVGRNPLPIFIPCHRIISSNGLGGYTPDVEIKKQLLKIELRDDATDFTVQRVLKLL